MGARRSRNVGQEVREHLVGRFGFELTSQHPGRYHRVVDGEHALVITDMSWNGSPKKQGDYLSLIHI